MGVIKTRAKWKKEGRGLVWKWCVEYAIHKKASSKDGIAYLKNNVPEQLWYQVQNTAGELYGN